MTSTLEKIRRAQLTAFLDVMLTWPIFYLSVLRSAYTEASLSTSQLSPLMRDITQGSPFVQTLKNHLSRTPFSTVWTLYEGAFSYFFTNYMWVVSAEFGVHALGRNYQLTGMQSSILAACMGGLLATPGDTLLIQHQTVRRALALRWNPFLEARGYFPTIVRENFFAFVALSGIQTRLADTMAEKLNGGRQNPLIDLAASALTSPVMLLGQPFNRMARVMQQERLGFFRANRLLCKTGVQEVKKLPPGTSSFKSFATLVQKAYFTGGIYRTWSMMMTGIIYGAMRTYYDRMDSKDEIPGSERLNRDHQL